MRAKGTLRSNERLNSWLNAGDGTDEGREKEQKENREDKKRQGRRKNEETRRWGQRQRQEEQAWHTETEGNSSLSKQKDDIKMKKKEQQATRITTVKKNEERKRQWRGATEKTDTAELLKSFFGLHSSFSACAVSAVSAGFFLDHRGLQMTCLIGFSPNSVDEDENQHPVKSSKQAQADRSASLMMDVCLGCLSWMSVLHE